MRPQAIERLGFDYAAATQSMIVAARRFVPFMRLSAAQRRAFVEEVLDVGLFSVMTRIAKDRIRENEADHREAVHGIELTREKLRSGNEVLTELRKSNEARRLEIETEITVLGEGIASRRAVLESKKRKIAELGDPRSLEEKAFLRVTEYEGLQLDLTQAMGRASDSIAFYRDNDVCPTCHQTMDEDDRNENIANLELKNNDRASAIKRLDERLDAARESLFRARRGVSRLGALEAETGAIRAEIMADERIVFGKRKELEKEDNSAKIDEVLERIEMLQDLETVEDERIRELQSAGSVLRSAVTVFGDDSAKAMIVKKYVPIINAKVNRFLEEMNFFVDFELDEGFEETIRSRYRDDFSYESFSEGERDRIDLSILLTWRAIAAQRNSISTNLLILDEVFDSSMDHEGVDDLTRLLRGMSETIFVISHKPGMEDRFERVLAFEKRNNFSVMSVADNV